MALISPRFAGNARLQAAARNAPPMAKYEPDREATRILQEALRDLGYAMPSTFATGAANGIYGDETVATVQKFQRDEKFPFAECDGRAGKNTLTRLDQKFQSHDPPTTPLPPGPKAAVTLRKSIFRMNDLEQQHYIEVIRRLNAKGIYARFVNRHRNMQHNMHAMSGGMPRGRMRFLPWHRVYVHQLEQAMQKEDPAAFVPYWYWQSSDPEPYPRWLDAFLGMKVVLPAVNSDLGPMTITVTRNHGSKQELLMMAQRAPHILNYPRFLEFTRDLEDEPHNAIHRWCGRGSTMRSIESPADPIF